jgi:hypothetical protein
MRYVVAPSREVIRQECLADLNRLEAACLDLITNPGHILDDTNEDIRLNPDGQPTPNEAIRQQAIAYLHEIHAERQAWGPA